MAGASAPSAGASAPSAEAAQAPATTSAAAPEEEAIEEGKIGGTTSTGRTAVLVGYGVKQTEAVRRPRRKDAIVRDIAAPPGEHIDTPANARIATLVAAHAPEIRRDNRTLAELAEHPAEGGPRAPALAKPPVRKYAKDRGVDLASVRGTGPGGSVTREDIDAALAPADSGASYGISGGAPR